MASLDAPPVFRLPAKPLQLLSPERVNASRTTSKTSKTSDSEYMSASTPSSPERKTNLFADYNPNASSKASGFSLPQSPSLPEIHAFRTHGRTNSDVQVLVKRFEHLDVRDKDAESSDRRKKHEAELHRAQIAREEAESDVKRLREETRKLKKDGDDGRERERMVGKRLEVVMEESASAKENYAVQTAVYEKEVRRSRKEAFKSSSAVVKLQEELKSTRNTLRITQSGFELEKQKVQRREQETFSAQYQLVAVQEELEKLTVHLKVVQEERDALKTSLKEEEVARIAAEGMIALPISQEVDDDLFSSPRRRSPTKRAPSPLSDDKENIHMTPRKTPESRRLHEELRRERIHRAQAEEMMEFLSLECQFRCCACQTAETHGHDLSLAIPADIAMSLDAIREDMRAFLTPMKDSREAQNVQIARTPVYATMDIDEQTKPEEGKTTPDDHGMEELHTAVSQEREFTPRPAVDEELPRATHPVPIDPASEHDEHDEQADTIMSTIAAEIPSSSSRPQTPTYQDASSTLSRPPFTVRTVTTTTTVPMHFTPAAKPPAPITTDNIPTPTYGVDATTPTFDRAAALAAIQYRRGRAKSIAEGHVTPRKQMLEGVKERRDISAPALGSKPGAGPPVLKGAASAGRVTGRRMG